MAKTLVDMTAEEREECVGMWCKSPAVRADVRVILLTDSGMVFFPAALKIGRLDPSIITPCHDLPRAWTPDGEPVDGAWEKSTAELPTKDYKGTFTQHYRRWVGEWEQNNE